MADGPAAPAPGPTTAPASPQAAIDKYAALTKSQDDAVVSRVENAIQHSPVGWLQSKLGESDAMAADARSDANGKLAEANEAIASHAKDAPQNAGTPPKVAAAPAVHVATPQTATAGASAPPITAAKTTPGPSAPTREVKVSAPAKATPAAATAAPPALAHALASVHGDAEMDKLLNAYSPKGAQATQTVGRIKQMGDIASTMRGSLDVYVARGNVLEQGLASVTNFFGMGKQTSAVWATNPYVHMGGVLGGFMTGLSALKNVIGLVGTICGKLGMVLTVVGLFGMIFPPIGIAVEGIARVLNVIGLICDGLSFVLSGVLTGLNGVMLAQQIAKGGSAEEKAATADLMMSEANDTASGVVNLVGMFGPRFMNGLLGSSKGIIGTLMRRAKSTIGTVANKITGNIKLIANKIMRRLPMIGESGARTAEGAWRKGVVGRTCDGLRANKHTSWIYNAPAKLGQWQNKAMERWGNTGFSRGLENIGAKSGAWASKYDYMGKIGDAAERAGSKIGGIGSGTKLGKKWALAADQAEASAARQQMQHELKDAQDLERARWRAQARSGRTGPLDDKRRKIEDRFVRRKESQVASEHEAAFKESEAKRLGAPKEKLDQDRELRQLTAKYSDPEKRAKAMAQYSKSHDRASALEKRLAPEEEQRQKLLAKDCLNDGETRTLKRLNQRLNKLDVARADYEKRKDEISKVATGGAVRKEDSDNWYDVYSKVKAAAVPVLTTVHLLDEQKSYEAAEDYKHLKWNAADAKKEAAKAGGHGTFSDIAKSNRRADEQSFSSFVRGGAARLPSPISAKVRSLLSPVLGRSVNPMAAGGAAGAAGGSAAGPAPAGPAPGPRPAQAIQPAAPQPATASTAVPAHDPGAAPTSAAAPTTAGHDAGAAGGGDAAAPLPYWPDLIPQFDHAQQDFRYLTQVAVEFRKAQIEGKQKAVDTLALYGQYETYAHSRAAVAASHQAESAQTEQSAGSNIGQAGHSEQNAQTGADKQDQAKGAANSKVGTDLPEPDTRSWWGRIVGRIKLYLRNKAAAIFGAVQNAIASVVLQGLCGVSMADLRDYAGAMKRQQGAAKGVANTAVATSAAVGEKVAGIAANANDNAKSAVSAIAECDANIHEADQFMADVVSFEAQLAEERAFAEVFLANVRSEARAAQHAEASQHKADPHAEGAEAAGEAAEGGVAGAFAAVAGPVENALEGSDPSLADVDAANGDDAAIHAAASLVMTEGSNYAQQLQTTVEDYKNQLAMAMTNRDGKSMAGDNLKTHSEHDSRQIVDDFKHSVDATHQQLSQFSTVHVDPSAAPRIAETIVTAAEHLETEFTDAQHALDRLFDATYRGIQGGEHSIKDRIINVGGINNRIDNASDHVLNDIPDPERYLHDGTRGDAHI